MDKEDKMFWDGFLKGILACEYAIGEASDLDVAVMAIRTIKQEAERLHTGDILHFLEQYKVE